MFLTATLLMGCWLFLLSPTTSALHYGVKNGGIGGSYCLIFDSHVSGTVNYYDTGKNATVAYDFTVPDSTNTSVSGNCFGPVDPTLKMSTENLVMEFFPNDIDPQSMFATHRWKVELKFANPVGSSFKIVDYKLKALFYPDIFNTSYPGNETVTFLPATGADFEWSAAAQTTHGFTCSDAVLSLENSTSLSFSHLNVVAFAALPSDQFPKEQLYEQCKLDVRTSDLVPILVGICLAGLVIIVLIAYLIGRARAKRQGYSSV